jgi:hypothetical protein
MSAIPQAITPNPHTNLLNVYIQIAIFFIIIPLFVQLVHVVDYKYILWIT